jgi:hypothetical protein
MKKAVYIFVALILGLLASVQLSAQCVPDTVNCVDTTGNPGEICPVDLPDAGLNALYDETITIIPPDTYEIFSAEVAIMHIKIDTVLNLPPGIDYYPNADTFFPDTAYCIQLKGTPTQTGVFDLGIYITATVDIGGPVEVQVVDSTSLSITVLEEVGLDRNQGTAFRVIPNAPNPFSEKTRLAYFTPMPAEVELFVYNILGSQVHHETVWSAPGTYNFSFDGRELPPGPYVYKVRTRDKYFTGKIMKSR